MLAGESSIAVTPNTNYLGHSHTCGNKLDFFGVARGRVSRQLEALACNREMVQRHDATQRRSARRSNARLHAKPGLHPAALDQPGACHCRPFRFTGQAEAEPLGDIVCVHLRHGIDGLICQTALQKIRISGLVNASTLAHSVGSRVSKMMLAGAVATHGGRVTPFCRSPSSTRICNVSRTRPSDLAPSPVIPLATSCPQVPL